jgi:hypothetical protein
MNGQDLAFTIHTRTGPMATRLPIRRAVIAGWTGRDAKARDHHIAELEALGIARPAATPIFYRVAASRLTFADAIEVSGDRSSGEVEFILVQAGGKTYVGVGSDHTDREVETYGVTVSKQMCDKPIASELWAFEDVERHWDRIVLRAHALIDGERVLYQEGALSGMLAPHELIAKGFGPAGMSDGTVLFGGTFRARGGIRPAARFEFEIDDPVLERRIGGGYDVMELPILG